MPPADTRTRILDRAERLFAESGFEGVSLREVGRAARVNSAAVHYHFGSREALVEAVVLRRMEAVQRRRRELLDALVAEGAARSVRRLLGVLVDPLVELVLREPRAGRAYVRLLARLYADRKADAYALAMRHFGEVHTELGHHLARALPDVPPPVLARRIALCVQATLATLADPAPYAVARAAGVPPDAPDAVARELVDFMAGGLCAPAGARGDEVAASASDVRSARAASPASAARAASPYDVHAPDPGSLVRAGEQERAG
ncbi:MAG: TetR/AcrR family transcriptional regulator [Myxococcota bacterium]